MTQSSVIPLRTPGSPRINAGELVMITVLGQIASPLAASSPYRIGQDGVPRVLPGTGGIVLSHRVGDPCVGLAGDHVEPGASIRNEGRSVKGERDGSNLALQTLTCIGNAARVVSGACAGRTGVVTGKHGGIDTVLVDFPIETLRRLAVGDRVQIYAYGTGVKLLDHPEIAVTNCSPRLLARWGLRGDRGRLAVPVTHLVPAALMGSGLGRADVVRGDYDIQMFDPATVRRFRLGTLRFGDVVAIVDADNRFGRSFRRGYFAIGCVVHGESTVAGHGPGVVTLLSGPQSAFSVRADTTANVARVLNVRRLSAPRAALPLGSAAGRSHPPPGRPSAADKEVAVLPSSRSLDHLAMHEQVRLTGGRCPRCRFRLRGCGCGGGCARCRGGHRFEAVGFGAAPRRRRRDTRTFGNAYDQSSEAFAELEALG